MHYIHESETDNMLRVANENEMKLNENDHWRKISSKNEL